METTREQLGKGGGGLGDDHRMIARAGGAHHTERQGGDLHGRAEPGPSEPTLSLAWAPGLRVIGRGDRCEAGLLRLLGVTHEGARRKLLMRGMIGTETIRSPLPSAPRRRA